MMLHILRCRLFLLRYGISLPILLSGHLEASLLPILLSKISLPILLGGHLNASLLPILLRNIVLLLFSIGISLKPEGLHITHLAF